MKLLVINGPNLNLLGKREPEIYGSETLEDLETRLERWATSLDIELEATQTNHEGVIIDHIQRSDVDGIVLNAGGYTHTSRAIADAIAAVSTPVVEVHISNIRDREPWRAISVIADVCISSIYGRGLTGYRDAMRHLVNRAAVPFETIRYGSDADNVADVRVGGDALAVLVHGGFWRDEWTKDTMESLAVDLAKHDVTSINVEYRRLGQDGGWPTTPDDVLSALDHIPDLDLSHRRLTLIGHSAGGQLAMWASWRSSTPVDQVVAMSPVVDLERHARSQMFGAAEAQVLIDQGAPNRISAGGVPTLLVHGEDDRVVPIGHSADLARSEGLELLTTSSGHFELLDPREEHWPKVRALILGETAT